MGRELTGRVIIITGASAGIGEATALRCAQAGMDVVLTARRRDRLDRVAERARRYGRRTVCVAGDVRDPDLNRRLLDTAREEFGRFDAVLANAGYSLTKPIVNTTADDFHRMFDVNVHAATELLRAAAATLIDRGRPGHLLMTSSCVSKFALPRNGAYAATKAAQDSICRAMRLELRDQGIDVSSVHPITTRTEFFEVASTMSGQRPAAGPPSHSPPMFVQTPDRVAKAIIRCLRRPSPEVWTSHIVRIVAGLATISPRFGDFVVRRQTAQEMRDAPPIPEATTRQA